MTDTPPTHDAPLGAPEIKPDTGRHPRTKTTRLPYLSVVAIAIVIVAIIGALTVRARLTAHEEVVGLDITPPTAPASPGVAAPRAPAPQPASPSPR